MNAERAAGLVQRWVGIYTRGLPAEIRQDRRDEIDDDLWSQLRDAAESARADQSLTGEIVIRLLFGIPSDLSWRAEQRHVGRKQLAPERSPTMGARVPALLAIVGGIGWVTWPIPQGLVGRGWPAGEPVSLLLFVSVVLGAWVLAAATFGLVATFQDRLRGVAAFLGSAGAAIGAISLFGFYAGVVAMPIGSAALMWDLRRAGVLGTWLAAAHVVAATLFMVPFVVLVVANSTLMDHPETAVPLLALDMPYGISWITIGWALRHSAPAAAGPVEGAA